MQKIAAVIRRNKFEIIVFVAAVAVWSVLAFPASIAMRSTLWGGGGDALGDATFFELLAHQPGPFPRVIHELGAPSGYAIPWARLIAQWPLTLYMLVVSGAVGGIFAMNLLSALGFGLTAAVVYGVCLRLCGDRLSALAGPIVVTFQAGQLWNGVGAQGFVHLWTIALVLYSFIRSLELPSKRQDLRTAAALYICMVWNPYLMLLGGVLWFFLSLVLVVDRRKRPHLKFQIRSTLLIGFGPAAAVTTAGTALLIFGKLGIRSNNPTDIDVFSARPLEYLLPGQGHALHGLFNFMDPRPETGTNLYVGIVALSVCVLAILFRRHVSYFSNVALVCGMTVIAGVIWSGPRSFTVLGMTVPLPAAALLHLTTTWRVVGRFGLVVLCAIGILTASSLATGREKMGTLVVVLVLGLLAVDLQSSRPTSIYRLGRSDALLCLRNLEDRVAIELPISDQNYEQWHRQAIHHKRIANGANPGDPWDVFLNRLEVDSNDLGKTLRSAGVGYIIIDQTQISPSTLQRIGRSSYIEESSCTDARFTVFEIAP